MTHNGEPLAVQGDLFADGVLVGEQFLCHPVAEPDDARRRLDFTPAVVSPVCQGGREDFVPVLRAGGHDHAHRAVASLDRGARLQNGNDRLGTLNPSLDQLGVVECEPAAGRPPGAHAHVVLPGHDEEQVGTQPLERTRDLVLHARADPNEEDDRGDADDHPEHRQKAPGLVRRQRAKRDAEALDVVHPVTSPTDSSASSRLAMMRSVMITSSRTLPSKTCTTRSA